MATDGTAGIRRVAEVRPPSVVVPTFLDPRLAPPIVRIAIDVPARRLQLGIDQPLAVSVPPGTRWELASSSIVWSSSDSSTIAVDPEGVARARGPKGGAWIRAALPGWRADSLWLEVTASNLRQFLDEEWTADWGDRWYAYGDPTPVTIRTPGGGSAFWNRGDGSFGSGAFSRQSIPAQEGVGVEAVISLPRSQRTGQSILLALVGALDSTSLAGWDFRTGGFPPVAEQLTRTCGLVWPAEHGRGDTYAFGVGMFDRLYPTGPGLLDGRWVRVRLQLFVDGSCGLAINGRAVARSWERIGVDRAVAVNLGYSSVGTMALIGRVTAWAGVRSDLDWSSVRSRRPDLGGLRAGGRP
jgi:hypothetical protein